MTKFIKFNNLLLVNSLLSLCSDIRTDGSGISVVTAVPFVDSISVEWTVIPFGTDNAICSGFFPMFCFNCGQELIPNETKDRICQDCGDSILQKYAQEINDLEQELQELKLFQAKPKSRRQTTQMEQKEIITEKVIEDLNMDLKVLEAESKKLELEIEGFKQDEFWARVNAEEHKNDEAYHENISTQRLIELNEKRLQMLQSNVYLDCFHINTEGHIATINNYKLGRVPWSEVNAALGEVVLLLDCLAHKFQFTYKFKLIVLGDFSKIQKDTHQYDLFASNDLTELLFSYKKFDQGLCLLLQNLNDLGEYLSSINRLEKFPYKIQADTVGGFSVKYNSNANWNQSMKFMLINIQSIINSL